MPSKTSVVAKEKLEKIVNDLGYELYEVEFEKKQNGMNLTLFIWADHPITLKDCELVHKTVNPVLDELDPTNGVPYYLNVSSVGLDKPIKTDKDFKRCLNTEIVVKLFASKNNKKQFEGVLKNFDDQSIKIEVNQKEITILKKEIAGCKPNIKF